MSIESNSPILAKRLTQFVDGSKDEQAIFKFSMDYPKLMPSKDIFKLGYLLERMQNSDTVSQEIKLKIEDERILILQKLQ